MESNSLRKIIESLIAQLEGNRFQDFCDRLGAELFPTDYHPVRAGGSRGDTKNDGYCPQARIFFAAHATRGEAASKTKVKLSSDLEGCVRQHRDVRLWRYLTNDTLRGEIEQYIDNDLRPRYPDVIIEVWGHKRIADEVSKFKIPAIEKILDVSLSSTATKAPPVRARPDPEHPKTMKLSLLQTGEQVWNVIADSHDYQFIKPSGCSEEELDDLARISDALTDWGDISGDLLDQTQQRDAQRSLSSLLEDVHQMGFALFGGKRRMLVSGDVEAVPGSWYRAVIYVVRRTNLPDKRNISLRITWG